MKIPETIGLIPDGNRRWAKKHGVSLTEAYKRGIKKIAYLAKWCREVGIKRLVAWGFSTENFFRERKEVEGLFRLFSEILEMMKKTDIKARLFFRGDLDRFPFWLRHKLQEIERSVRGDGLEVWILLAYGGRQEILKACKECRGDEKEFMKHLYFPYEPDLIIRTAEMRTSGFLPFQSAYSEWVFFKKLWPDFTKADFRRALAEYARRERKFGR